MSRWRPARISSLRLAAWALAGMGMAVPALAQTPPRRAIDAGPAGPGASRPAQGLPRLQPMRRGLPAPERRLRGIRPRSRRRRRPRARDDAGDGRRRIVVGGEVHRPRAPPGPGSRADVQHDANCDRRRPAQGIRAHLQDSRRHLRRRNARRLAARCHVHETRRRRAGDTGTRPVELLGVPHRRQHEHERRGVEQVEAVPAGRSPPTARPRSGS